MELSDVNILFILYLPKQGLSVLKFAASNLIEYMQLQTSAKYHFSSVSASSVSSATSSSSHSSA